MTWNTIEILKDISIIIIFLHSQHEKLGEYAELEEEKSDTED
jgi:hypothetical protein